MKRMIFRVFSFILLIENTESNERGAGVTFRDTSPQSE